MATKLYFALFYNYTLHKWVISTHIIRCVCISIFHLYLVNLTHWCFIFCFFSSRTCLFFSLGLQLSCTYINDMTEILSESESNFKKPQCTTILWASDNCALLTSKGLESLADCLFAQTREMWSSLLLWDVVDVDIIFRGKHINVSISRLLHK